MKKAQKMSLQTGEHVGRRVVRQAAAVFMTFAFAAAGSLGARASNLPSAGVPSAVTNEEVASTRACGTESLEECFLSGSLRLGQVLHSPKGAPDPSRAFVRLELNPFSLPNQSSPIILETVRRLAAAFGPNNFEAIVISDTRLASEISTADLYLGSAGTFRKSLPGGARDLATIVSGYYPDPNHGEGGLFITKKGSGIRRFEDLEGKRIAFMDPNAFSGYAVGLGEAARRGFDPDRFFGEAVFAGAMMPKEIDLLRSGRVDAALVRTCFMEELAALGVDISDLEPAAVRTDLKADFRCLASTDLYPQWTLFTTPSATPETARLAAATLLGMPPGAGGLRWSVATDFTAVDELYKSIRLGPYAYLRTWSLSRFYNEYRTEIYCGVLLCLTLALYALGASFVIRRRTAQLSEAMAAQNRSDRQKREAEVRLERLERTGAITQMSYVVAHELRQPLAAIINFTHGISRLADAEGMPDKELIMEGAERIGAQARLAEAIVQKVRSYSKRPAAARVLLDLAASAEKALETLLATKNDWQAGHIRVERRFSSTPVLIFGDPLEMELIAINLIKNALEAADSDADGWVRLTVKPDFSGEVSYARLIVENGPNGKLTPQTRARLESFGQQDPLEMLSSETRSTKPEGLGLGLEIVRTLLARYGGQLRFEVLANGTVRACASLLLSENRETTSTNKGDR